MPRTSVATIKRIKLIAIFIAFQYIVPGQNIILIKDSIMDAHMRSGFATRNFRPTGKFNDNNKRQGKWEDYEVREDGSFQMQEGMPMKTISIYLLYGEGEYADDLRTGPWKIFVIENSSLKKILSKTVTYIDGKENGSFKYFYPDGNIAQTGNYVNGFIEDSSFMYYQDQKIFARQYFKSNDKDGERKYFYPGGKLMYTFNYSDGVREGPYVAYYENGNTKESFAYKSDKIHGPYKYYYENGNLWTEKIYSDGLLLNVTRLLSKNGKDLDPGTLVNGNGYVNYYTEDGKIYSMVTYKNGVEVKQ